MSEQEAPKKLGRYEIVGELGKGAMGIVYEGRDPNIGRRVAIKTARRDILEASGRADELMERFLREAQAAGALNHPNIITIYDAAEEGGMAYIAMEYLQGGDLEGYMAKHKNIDTEVAVDIVATLCSALAAAHVQGIVHRDIKPANVMTLEDGTIKIADFGIARVSDSNLTQEGSMIGTPHYMSPEQFQGRKVDGRSDLFAAGVILYELLTEEKPFVGEALSTVMTAVIKSTPIEPHELNTLLGLTLSQVIMKALSKNPNDRYQDGETMSAALREAIKPNPDPAITQLASADATLVAGGADATVVAGEATLVAPPQSDATVVGSAPPQQSDPNLATLAASAPSGQAAVAGEHAPKIAPSETPPAAAPVVSPPSAQKKAPMVPIAAGAVAVLVVVGGLAYMFSGGGGTAPANGTPAGGSNVASIETMAVTVHGIDSQALFDSWDGDNRNPPEGAFPIEGTVIIMYDPATDTEIDRFVTNESGYVLIKPKQAFESVDLEVRKGGYKNFGKSPISASKPGEEIAVPRVLIHESISEL